jgi:hypothetical protein
MDSCVQLDATSNKVVAFAWTEPDNGGSQVLDYLIFAKIDDEQEYWQLDSDFDALEYYLSTDVVEGATYSLILKAKNKWGFAAEWSEPCSVFAATVPDQVEDL